MLTNITEAEDARRFITKRRLQILVHSCIYYKLNSNLITDKQWDTWARELVEVQTLFDDIAEECPWHNEFKDFDATTGFDLPLWHPWVLAKANHLLNYTKNTEGVK